LTLFAAADRHQRRRERAELIIITSAYGTEAYFGTLHYSGQTKLK